MPVRPIDHLVLPVTDIATARSRLTQLGFTVAADGRHPFGTENACVFFSDKTYLEPLGVADAEDYASAIRAGNQFVARDAAFRLRNGPEGLSAVVFGTDDADADHDAFRAGGLSAGDQLTFSRVMQFPDGTEIEPRFKLSFAADLKSPDFFAFTCQRIDMPPADRAALERHANGATGGLTVYLAAPEPDDVAAFMTTILGGPPSSIDDEGINFRALNAQIRIWNADGYYAFDGRDLDPDRPGLRAEALGMKVEDLATAEACLKSSQVDYTRIGGSLLIRTAPGQGVPYVLSAEK